MNYIDEIKNSISMIDVVNKYGIEVFSKNFVLCPFHNEKTPSMKIYDDTKGFYCFGCGASGDIFTFTQRYFNINFTQALSKLNNDFGFNFPINQKLSARQKIWIDKKTFERKREKKSQELAYSSLINDFLDAHSEIIQLERQKLKYAPKTQDEELNQLFVEALKKIEAAYFNLECAEMELIKWKARK